MSDLFPKRDNEFIAWYPNDLSTEEAQKVWTPKRAAYYVHIPFCTAICDYCAFSIAKLKESNPGRYLTALRTEIERYAQSGRLAGYQFESGHFGGGTPSAIDAADLMAIKKLIDTHFNVASTAEIAVEVNPISFTLEKARTYFECGVNRISFGVQSFDDKTLKTIGRPHRVEDTENTLKIIREVGWENFSFDIMYGAPGQTLEELRSDLLRAVDYSPAHISCFRLEIIPFTALKMRERVGLLPARLSVELLTEMDNLVDEILTSNGYLHYGAFDFAKPGFESVHNKIAFMAPQGEYIGFGNGSYSFINEHVYTNYADLPSYENAIFEGKDPIALAKKATALELMSRYFVLGIKFFSVSRGNFIEQFGLKPEDVFPNVLERLLGEDLLALEQDYYILTQKGRHYINNVCKEFYVGDNRMVGQHLQFVPTLTQSQIEYFASVAGGKFSLFGGLNQRD